jgi:hypothetical protein
MSGTVESDTEKKKIMEIYSELGGSKASEGRGNKACEALEQGKTIDELASQAVTDALKSMGRYQNGALSNSEKEKWEMVSSIYTAEALAAQSSICPETKVDLKF